MRLILSCLLIAAATLFTFGDSGRILKTKNSPLKEGTRGIVIDINGETFTLGDGVYTWNAAKTVCNLLGMQMLTLDTLERWVMISDWFRENPDYDYWTWSAGQKPVGQEEFMWMSTGENFNFTAWNPGEPSATSQEESCMNFIGFNYSETHGWDDDECSRLFQVMCEAVK